MSDMQHQGEHPLFKMSVWTIAVPVFIDFLLTFSVFFTDSIFLSRLSDTAAASVGSTISIFMIAVLLFMMLAQGGQNVAGQFLGAGRMDKAVDAYAGTLLINTICGVGGFLLFFFGSSMISEALGLQGQALQYADTYLHWISFTLIAIAMKTALAVVFISQGKAVWNMYAGLLINALNIVLNVVFLQATDLGLHGVILATTISQVAVVLFFAVAIRARLNIRYDWKRYFSSFGQTNKPILAIGVPSAVQPISSELGLLVISALAIYIGDVGMATRTYVMNVLTLGICWASSIAIGNQVLVAYRVGAQRIDDAKQVLSKNLRIAMAGSLVIGVLLYLLSDPLIGIFTDNEEVLRVAAQMLLIGIVLEPLRSLKTMTGYALKASGDAAFPALWSILVTWLVAIPTAYFLGVKLNWGMAGLWAALAVDEGLCGVITLGRWMSGKWASRGVVDADEVTANGGQ